MHKIKLTLPAAALAVTLLLSPVQAEAPPNTQESEDLLWMSLCVCREAANEPFKGQVAVAHTIINRSRISGDSFKKTILRPWQYSWSMSSKLFPYLDHKKPWRFTKLAQCMEASKKALETPDIANITYYFADYIKPPTWAAEKKFEFKIGHHSFYSGKLDSYNYNKKTKLARLKPTARKIRKGFAATPAFDEGYRPQQPTLAHAVSIDSVQPQQLALDKLREAIRTDYPTASKGEHPAQMGEYEGVAQYPDQGDYPTRGAEYDYPYTYADQNKVHAADML